MKQLFLPIETTVSLGRNKIPHLPQLMKLYNLGFAMCRKKTYKHLIKI